MAESNFPVNFGLRYEFVTIPIEVNGKIALLHRYTDRSRDHRWPRSRSQSHGSKLLSTCRIRVGSVQSAARVPSVRDSEFSIRCPSLALRHAI